MLLIIVGVFFICWGPKLLLNVMKKHLLLVLQTDIAFNISVRTSIINDYYFSPASFALLRSVWSTRALAYRHIGRYRRSKYRKLPTSCNTARQLLHVYFQLRTAHCFFCQKWWKLEFNFRVIVGVKVTCRSGLSTSNFKDIIDFSCFERR